VTWRWIDSYTLRDHDDGDDDDEKTTASAHDDAR
jgi:hypothetical protein